MVQHRKKGMGVNIYIQNITAGNRRDDVRRWREPAASPFDNDILTPEPYLHLMVM